MIYLIVFLISTFFVFLAEISFNKNKKWQGILFSCIGILIPSILAGLRAETIGTDTDIYVKPLYLRVLSANNLSKCLITVNNLTGIELGYCLLVYVITKIFKSIHVLLFVLQLIVFYFVYQFLYYKRDKISMSLGFLVFLLIFYNTSLSISRQSIAMAILLYSLIFNEKKEYGKLVLCMIIGYLFHRTIIVGIPIHIIFYIFNNDKITRRSKYIILVLSIIFIILIGMNVQSVLNILFSMQILPEKYLNYISTEDWTKESVSVFSISSRCIWLVLFIFFEFYKKDDLATYFIFYIISFGTYSLVEISVNFVRLGLYFYVISMIVLLPSFLKYTKKDLANKALCIFMIFSILVVCWYYQFIILNDADTYPYVSDVIGGLRD